MPSALRSAVITSPMGDNVCFLFCMMYYYYCINKNRPMTYRAIGVLLRYVRYSVEYGIKAIYAKLFFDVGNALE
jgi:hypothetical protein